MFLKIIAPVKQVPESGNVKINPETGTIIRAGVESVVNPLDLYALEAALLLRERYGAEITALSMGPPQAMRALREAAAMGCDRATLVSDRLFSGSDTLATSCTLARAVRKLGPFDLIVTGERATDGDTAQVGPGIAAWLDIPVLTYVSKITEISGIPGGTGMSIRAERLSGEGYEMVCAELPCLITVVKEIGPPRLPTLKGKIRSMEMDIPVLNAESLELDRELLGLNGSPTRVVKIDTPRITRGGKLLRVRDNESLDAVLDELIAFLGSKGIL
ncbi:MAG: electron transfer flavoprotein subunit beta/FixA family protein [Treponema sp.]|jgi:electron transfer flavoprotein beta subunit|nr:electron transfer flavoprotein subunit beta/FixA family protein [Treponema sp.]